MQMCKCRAVTEGGPGGSGLAAGQARSEADSQLQGQVCAGVRKRRWLYSWGASALSLPGYRPEAGDVLCLCGNTSTGGFLHVQLKFLLFQKSVL